MICPECQTEMIRKGSSTISGNPNALGGSGSRSVLYQCPKCKNIETAIECWHGT